MKRTGWNMALVCCLSVVLLLAPSAARANDCGADATLTNYHVVDGHKYLFAFDVHASACGEYSCNGWVNYVIRYHYRGEVSTVTDRTLVRFRIESGNSAAHVSDTYYVGATDDVVVDDAGVESVDCTSP